MRIELTSVSAPECDEFLEMAEQYYRELNPSFVPHEDWKRCLFGKITSNARIFARWIVNEDEHLGFVLFGLEDHRFLPRVTGMIYELYVKPEFRRKGVARECAIQVIGQLHAQNPSKIRLEVMEGNNGAAALWRSLGFEKVSDVMVLERTKA